MRFASALFVICGALSSTAQAQTKQQHEPAERPQWALVRSKAEAAIRPTLFDPESAQIQWTSGFEWGSSKPLIGRRTWGWVGCVSLNAKNRLGGYVGAETYWVLYKADGQVTWGGLGSAFTQCDNPGKVALQPELVSATSSTSAAPSVADELSKLASLLDRGLISREEFDTQKAKLLAK